MPVSRRVLSAESRAELVELIRGTKTDRVLADRVRMVLWWDDGMSTAEISGQLGVTPRTAASWRSRYAVEGVAGLADRPKALKRRVYDGGVRSRLVALTRMSPPAELGRSHWSSCALARYFTRTEGVRISYDFVADVWREHGLQPWWQGTFKLSNDLAFAAKVVDIVGLYLNPPSGAVVLLMDGKTQVQALDRTQPVLPIDFGKTEKRTYDYACYGTTDLFAALNVGTGDVAAACYPTHKTADFLRFMDTVIAKHPDQRLHVVLDNASAHRSSDMVRWLATHPAVTFHFTPMGGSWINQIETWFGILTRQSLRRGTHTSVKLLTAAIHHYVADWNEDCRPFEWTATAEQIIVKVQWVESEVRKMTRAREVKTITGH